MLVFLLVVPFTYISSRPFTACSISVDGGRGLGSLAVGYIWANYLALIWWGLGIPIPLS